MIELPEAFVLSQQINEMMGGKRITGVYTNKSPHKFAWFHDDPQKYQDILSGRYVGKAENCGGYIEIEVEDAILLFGEGVNLRYFPENEKLPDKHQLDIEFEDNSHLIASVQMYGGLWAFTKGQFDNYYYLNSKEKTSVLSDDFSESYFFELLGSCSEKYSLKAVLATEQRIPGLGNGVLQDILFRAGFHPKKKLKSLSDNDKSLLYKSVKNTIGEMTFKGGRDTERDLYGCLGGYKTVLSKNTSGKQCLVCGNKIIKEAYMGGSIYYCEGCQKL